MQNAVSGRGRGRVLAAGLETTPSNQAKSLVGSRILSTTIRWRFTPQTASPQVRHPLVARLHAAVAASGVSFDICIPDMFVNRSILVAVRVGVFACYLKN